jgi:hypothetical protein
MPIVFLALNGDGLGHLVRASLVCDALYAAGERPIIFSQGLFPLDARSPVAGTTVPPLWKAPYQIIRSVGRALNAAALISPPSVVVEDTHPGPVTIRAGIARSLLVRPTAFDELEELREDFAGVYRSFVLCDAPGSVSWPYTPEQTAAIHTWDGWHIIGPLYRTAGADDIAEVRIRHQIGNDRRVCVFSMGGGGRHVPDDRDAETFVVLAHASAERLLRIDATVRLLFVKGPYFPADVAIGAPFEVIDREPLMPALLAAADGAIIRAGFNTPWECISAGTPFMPFIGTTVNEPVADRVAAIRARGLLPESVEQFWLDEGWRTAYRRGCREVAAEFPGRPDGARLQQLLVPPPSYTPLAPAPARRSRGRERPGHERMPFVIRVDGVATAEPALLWLLELLAMRRLRASLQIVPYSCEIDATTLATFDPGETLFEVGQYGYAGIPYAPESVASDRTLHEIAAGRRYLEDAFAGRWKGGLSTPFDTLPAGLREVWLRNDGSFISRRMFRRSTGGRGDTVAGIDLWDGHVHRPATLRSVARELGRQAASYGYAGLVLQPRMLRAAGGRAHLVAVLALLERSGITSTSLRAISENAATAARRAERALRDARWGFAIAARAALRDPDSNR